MSKRLRRVVEKYLHDEKLLSEPRTEPTLLS